MNNYYLLYDEDLRFLMDKVAGYIQVIRRDSGAGLDPLVVKAFALALRRRLNDAKPDLSEFREVK